MTGDRHSVGSHRRRANKVGSGLLHAEPRSANEVLCFPPRWNERVEWLRTAALVEGESDACSETPSRGRVFYLAPGYLEGANQGGRARRPPEPHHGVDLASNHRKSIGCGKDAWYTTFTDVRHFSALLKTEEPTGRPTPVRPNRVLLPSAS